MEPIAGNNLRALVGGISGILSALCFLGSALVNGLILQDSAAYGWFGLFGTILAIVFVWALYLRAVNDTNRQTLQLAAILFVVGGILYTWLYFGALIGSVVQPLVAETGAQAELWTSVSQQLSQASVVTGTVYFIGTLLFAANALRRGPGPRWANWVGVVGSALAFFWFGLGILPDILGLVAAVGFILTWVWMIAHGVQMLRGA